MSERIVLPILDAVTMTAACTQMLSEARVRASALARLPLEDVSPELVLDRWDEDAVRLEDIVGPVAILNHVHPDKAVRDAADACMRELASFQVELFQDEALFERVRRVEPRTEPQRQSRLARSRRRLTLSKVDRATPVPSRDGREPHACAASLNMVKAALRTCHELRPPRLCNAPGQVL